MHACLNVDEILRLIACELVASEGQATAVALACCCKSFEDPVLDALWETQYRLTPLLKSLPGDIWDGGECTVSTPITHTPSLPQLFHSKVFQEAPNEAGVNSFPKVRSKDARGQI